MNNFKKDLVCNITLIVTLALTVAYLLVISLNLFGAINLNFYSGFNYIVAYVLAVVCLALYIVGFFVSKFKRISFPKWLRVCFYVAFFLFTNLYYLFNLHTNIFGIVVIFAYIAFLINIVAVSVFYNIQKDENHKLRTSRKFISTSVLLFSLGAMFVIETFICAIKSFFFAKAAVATITTVMIELCSMLFVTLVMYVIFNISLAKSKRLINACLVKTNFDGKPQKSIKEN